MLINEVCRYKVNIWRHELEGQNNIEVMRRTLTLEKG